MGCFFPLCFLISYHRCLKNGLVFGLFILSLVSILSKASGRGFMSHCFIRDHHSQGEERGQGEWGWGDGVSCECSLLRWLLQGACPSEGPAWGLGKLHHLWMVFQGKGGPGRGHAFFTSFHRLFLWDFGPSFPTQPWQKFNPISLLLSRSLAPWVQDASARLRHLHSEPFFQCIQLFWLFPLRHWSAKNYTLDAGSESSLICVMCDNFFIALFFPK